MRRALYVCFPYWLFPRFTRRQTNTCLEGGALVFDGTSDRWIVPGVVVVSGNKIQAIGGTAPANATVIDLGDATLCRALSTRIRT